MPLEWRMKMPNCAPETSLCVTVAPAFGGVAQVDPGLAAPDDGVVLDHAAQRIEPGQAVVARAEHRVVDHPKILRAEREDAHGRPAGEHDPGNGHVGDRFVIWP